MSADRLADEVANRNRPSRALLLLREIYRIKTITNSMGFASHHIWDEVRVLLAEDQKNSNPEGDTHG